MLATDCHLCDRSITVNQSFNFLSCRINYISGKDSGIMPDAFSYLAVRVTLNIMLA